ncbi:hypothetical protein WR25_11059 [Diploscapter pachys]|uniref:Uncharacterized protein n=1 Tax=Diploscapter pachys TaxID=2018661 RepID=A0A2A2K3E2_9BILA|nr:hypothetical protein WR25_11059 [Diploscapter pachys]
MPGPRHRPRRDPTPARGCRHRAAGRHPPAMERAGRSAAESGDASRSMADKPRFGRRNRRRHECVADGPRHDHPSGRRVRRSPLRDRRAGHAPATAAGRARLRGDGPCPPPADPHPVPSSERQYRRAPPDPPRRLTHSARAALFTPPSVVPTRARIMDEATRHTLVIAIIAVLLLIGTPVLVLKLRKRKRDKLRRRGIKRYGH